MDIINIILFNASGLIYYSCRVTVPDGLLRWDPEFHEFVKNSINTKILKNSVVVVVDDEDNTKKFSTCYFGKRLMEVS